MQDQSMSIWYNLQIRIHTHIVKQKRNILRCVYSLTDELQLDGENVLQELTSEVIWNGVFIIEKLWCVVPKIEKGNQSFSVEEKRKDLFGQF